MGNGDPFYRVLTNYSDIDVQEQCETYEDLLYLIPFKELNIPHIEAFKKKK